MTIAVGMIILYSYTLHYNDNKSIPDMQSTILPIN